MGCFIWCKYIVYKELIKERMFFMGLFMPFPLCASLIVLIVRALGILTDPAL